MKKLLLLLGLLPVFAFGSLSQIQWQFKLNSLSVNGFTAYIQSSEKLTFRIKTRLIEVCQALEKDGRHINEIRWLTIRQNKIEKGYRLSFIRGCRSVGPLRTYSDRDLR